MSLKLHDPPGFVKDLLDANKQTWSDTISALMLTENVSSTLTPQFYDQTKVVEKNPTQPQKITWIGFPKKVKLDNPNDVDRWKVADSDRGKQDEYLEWSIKRDPTTKKILKIVFCNEGPEYFEFLGKVQPDTLIKLYQDLNPGVSITEADLFTQNADGVLVYNPLNKWNDSTTTGTIMHLIQENNTLGAEVDLGARATVLRKRADGTLITDSDELITCSEYGNPNRNSDPTIGANINAIARSGVMLTIENPIALYIDSINWVSIDAPVGHEDDDPKDFWKWTRGTEGHYMRAEFEVPDDKEYVLGDLLVNGKSLDYGGQIADFIKISITAHASDLQIQPRFCSEAPPPPTKASLLACQCGTVNHQQHTKNTLPGLANHKLTR